MCISDFVLGVHRKISVQTANQKINSFVWVIQRLVTTQWKIGLAQLNLVWLCSQSAQLNLVKVKLAQLSSEAADPRHALWVMGGARYIFYPITSEVGRFMPLGGFYQD